MSLSNRKTGAQHDTAAVQKFASSPETEFYERQRVVTVDGFIGTVASVDVTPFGAEDYEIVLDGGMGGGSYTASQLSPVPTTHAATGVHMASDDYPALADILFERPDIAGGRLKHQSAAINPNLPLPISSHFLPGQRILTFDGLPGTVTGLVSQGGASSFTGGLNAIYAVVLDGGMGGGTYSESDLRPQFMTTLVRHQADMSNQMDGGFEDVSDPASNATLPEEDGGDLQTGASFHYSINENQMTSEDSNDSWGQDGDDSTNVVASKTDDYATYKNPVSPGAAWKMDGVTEHKEFEPEHHPIARERFYPMGAGGDADGPAMAPKKPQDVSKKYEPTHLYSENSLGYSETTRLLMEAQIQLEAAVNNSWGEPAPDEAAPKPYGATSQKDPKANPGSTGWATQGDPESWQGVGPGSFGHSDRLASLAPQYYEMAEELAFEAASSSAYNYDDEMMFEAGIDQSGNGQTIDTDNTFSHAAPTLMGGNTPALMGQNPAPDPGNPGGGAQDGQEDPDQSKVAAAAPAWPSGPKGGKGGEMPGSTGTSSGPEGPEATLKDEPEAALPATDGGLGQPSMEEGLEADDFGDDQSLTPSHTASLTEEQILAQFQATASHLAKTALKDYSPAEQNAIINEGPTSRAQNLDRLQLEGTHYAVDEDETWMA